MRDTSIEAYLSIFKDLNSKQQQVLFAIEAHQPISDYGISQVLGWEINTVTPRRGELEKKGVIVSHKKVTGHTNRKVWTWKLKPVEGQLNMF